MSNLLIPFLAGAATLYVVQDATKETHRQPRFNVLATRTQEGLTEETNEIIDLITVDPTTFPVGSFRYKAHRYPGDIDIFEKVKACCTTEQAKREIAKHLQQLGKNIKNSSDKGVFFGDFKAGIDDRYRIDIGNTDDNNKIVGYSAEKIRNELSRLFRQELLTKTELNYLHSLVEENPTLEEWEALYNALRKFYLVRWTLDELIAGKKTLTGNKRILLSDAIAHDSIVKIDIWAPLKGKYNEITNFFLVILQTPDGNETVLNAELGDRIRQLDKDIRKYSSPEHRNSLKLAKRMWNKALTLKDKKLYNKLYPLFDSDAAMLSQINSEIEVIANMFEGLPRDQIPIEVLMEQIDGFKERVQNTFEIRLSNKPIKIIDNLLKYYYANPTSWNPDVIIHYLKDLYSLLKRPIEDYSREFLKTNNIKV